MLWALWAGLIPLGLGESWLNFMRFQCGCAGLNPQPWRVNVVLSQRIYPSWINYFNHLTLPIEFRLLDIIFKIWVLIMTWFYFFGLKDHIYFNCNRDISHNSPWAFLCNAWGFLIVVGVEKGFFLMYHFEMKHNLVDFFL